MAPTKKDNVVKQGTQKAKGQNKTDTQGYRVNKNRNVEKRTKAAVTSQAQPDRSASPKAPSPPSLPQQQQQQQQTDDSSSSPSTDPLMTNNTLPPSAQPHSHIPPSTTASTIPLLTPDIFRQLLPLYDTQIIHIASNTVMTSKTTRILAHLGKPSSSSTNTKSQIQPLIVLIAKSNVANKLIGIIEIVKREMDGKGEGWFQYNVLSSVIEEEKKKKKEGTGSVKGSKAEKGGEMMGEVEEEGESDFETIKTPLEREIEGRPKIRAIPVISIALSRTRIDALRTVYGEQSAVKDTS